MNIRVLMADDHKIFLEGLRSLLSTEPQMEVVAEVDNGRSAVDLLVHAAAAAEASQSTSVLGKKRGRGPSKKDSKELPRKKDSQGYVTHWGSRAFLMHSFHSQSLTSSSLEPRGAAGKVH